MSDLCWQPSEKQIAAAQITHYQQYVNQHYKKNFTTYAELYRWSVTAIEDFWQSVWDYFHINAHTPYQTILQTAERMQDTRWFVGATLNFAEHLLSRNDDKTALIYVSEDGQRHSLTYAELTKQVASLAATLRDWGIQPGDRIAAIVPNRPEAIIAMLAAASLGAVWSCCSPEFGVQGILDRFGQIEPRVLFTIDSQQFNGKTHAVLPKAQQCLQQLPSVEKFVVIATNTTQPDIKTMPQACLWQDALIENVPLEFTPVAFDHPLYILYSSGTTGAPKCIVHATGRVLLQHLKELCLHTNMNKHDTFFYYTTTGWMMWNWAVSALATGATLVLYDGAPMAPNNERLFDLIDAERISVFGTSAKFISAAEKAHLIPRKTHQLGHLRCMLSTGSPLVKEGFDYVYRDIKTDVHLASISGGTDIVSCFALGNPTLPVYRGELQCRGLGMMVEIFDAKGHALKNKKGELVCSAPFIAMPIYFWNDPDGDKYYHAYFEKYDHVGKHVWAHGDYAALTTHDGLIIYGRSDAVLNPGGVRIGTAEIYRQVEQMDDILESLVVGQTWHDDERIILFVKLRPNKTLDDTLRQTIKETIRTHASPRHVPAKIIQVPDIPRTLSGKIVELTVRNVIHNLPVTNKEALANPEALDFFAHLKELTEE